MAGLDVLTGNERISILQCQELAKKIGFNTTTFDLVGPTGKLKCKWIDAYYGIFEVIEPGQIKNGFIAKEIMFVPDIYCDNVCDGQHDTFS